MHFLFEQNLLTSRALSDVRPGDLAVYLDNDRFCHVGRVKRMGRIESKWGLGQLYEHSLWEVPSSYGSQLRCFDGLDRREALGMFINYAKSKGLVFRDANDA
jgi:hypothetical protein